MSCDHINTLAFINAFYLLDASLLLKCINTISHAYDAGDNGGIVSCLAISPLNRLGFAQSRKATLEDARNACRRGDEYHEIW